MSATKEEIEKLAEELHQADKEKVGNSIMVGQRGSYPVRWPSWEEFSESSRENYRKQAIEILEKGA
jgi:hypothetical protein